MTQFLAARFAAYNALSARHRAASESSAAQNSQMPTKNE